MTDYAPWLRELAAKGGRHTVSNIDARSLGRIADEIERDRSARLRDIAEIERLRIAKRAALKIADERSRENVDLRAENERLRTALEPFAQLAHDAELRWGHLPSPMKSQLEPADADVVTTTVGQCRRARETLRHEQSVGDDQSK